MARLPAPLRGGYTLIEDGGEAILYQLVAFDLQDADLAEQPITVPSGICYLLEPGRLAAWSGKPLEGTYERPRRATEPTWRFEGSTLDDYYDGLQIDLGSD